MYDSNTKKSTYQYCEDGKCLEAACDGEKLSDGCTYTGESKLKEQMTKTDVFNRKFHSDFEKNWKEHCLKPIKNPKIICHEGEFKKMAPANDDEIEKRYDIIQSVYDKGEFTKKYRQIFILK